MIFESVDTYNHKRSDAYFAFELRIVMAESPNNYNGTGGAVYVPYDTNESESFEAMLNDPNRSNQMEKIQLGKFLIYLDILIMNAKLFENYLLGLVNDIFSSSW